MSELSTYAITDYEFVCLGGIPIPISINHTLGDTISDTEHGWTVSLVSKPSKTNPKATLPAMTSTVYRDKVIAVRQWERTEAETPKEVTEEIFKLVSQGPKRIQ